jgi:hypothetical protein
LGGAVASGKSGGSDDAASSAWLGWTKAAVTSTRVASHRTIRRIAVSQGKMVVIGIFRTEG